MLDNKGYFEENKILIIDVLFNPYEDSYFEKNGGLEKIIENSKLIIFNFQENIPVEILLLIEDLTKKNVKFYVFTFCISLKNYLDKKYKNNKVEFPNIYTSNKFHYTTTHYDMILNPEGNREYDLMYFHASRKPHRDKTTEFLINNQLINHKNIISIRYNDELDKSSTSGESLIYNDYHKQNTFLEIDYDYFDGYNNIHHTQVDVVPWRDQRYQDLKLYEAHLNSKFNIITEAVYPYSQSNHEILRNISSVSKRTIFPILFKNVFHIYPENKPLQTWLTENEFELFFDNDSDFLNNINSEFYYRNEVQEKLEHNAKLMREYFMDSAYDIFVNF